MKLVFEKIPHEHAQSFHCEHIRARDYGCTWHFHPEIELTLVRKSQGHRMIGDKITPLVPGDLVLVGSGLPHLWHQDSTQDASRRAVDAIVIQFAADFLGAGFLERPELHRVSALFGRAARGLHVTGRTRAWVAAEMERLLALRGLEKLLALLGILMRLATARDLKPIASLGFHPTLDRADETRMERVCRFIDRRLAEPIMRDDCAATANLSPGAFSRFFKARTGKSLPAYVNELRIGRASRRLAQTDDPITEIALAGGFPNLSNFNQKFRLLHGTTPRAYRRQSRTVNATE